MVRGIKITLRDIVKRYQDKTVLDIESLEFKPGKITTLLGPSGCGKTTTLKIIAGLVKPDRGRVLFDDRDVTSTPPEKRNIGMVFQDLALFPHMTVYDNVAFGLRVRRVDEREITEKVNSILDMVGLPHEEFAKRRVTELSGGQQQRVALARALVIEPGVLLLDEPFAHLDYKIKQKLLGEIRRLQKKLHTTIIYVTHDQEEAMLISDYIVIMNNGRVEQFGTPEEVYLNPKTRFVAEFFGDANIVPGHIAGLHGYSILVRPESVIIGGQGDITIDGVVDDVIFQGAFIRVDVRVNGSTVKAVVPRSRLLRLEPGDRITIGWSRSDMKVLKD